MAEGKRYYWLKLREDFFTSKRIKKLRNMAGGDTYTIIYLKMQLLALKTEGVITWTGLEDNFAEELALDLDEKPSDVEMTLMYLLKTGLIETNDKQHFFLPYVLENTGSEGASAQRWREWKARQELVTNGIALESNTPLTDRKRITNGEIEKEKEIEIELERDKEIEKENNNTHILTHEESEPVFDLEEAVKKWGDMIVRIMRRNSDPTGMVNLAVAKGVPIERIREYVKKNLKEEAS